MTRRRFIKSGALFVPATFGIFVPRLRCPAPVVVNSYRFGSAWTPLRLSVAALQYLRADRLAADGGADASSVATWTADAGPSPTQGAGGNQPTLRLNTYGATHACVRFDSNDVMDHTSVASVGCWMVIKGTAWSAIAAYISGGSGCGYWSDIVFYGAGPGGYDGSNELGANSSNRIATGSLHSLLIAGDKVWIDGAEVSGYRIAGTPGAVAVTRLNNRTDVGGFSSAFDLVEIAHFSGVPTSGDRSALFTWGQTLGAP